MNKKRVSALLLIVLISVQQSAFAWGNDGHMWVNWVAAKRLPKSMPSFLRDSADRLEYLGPEPDRWRNQYSEPTLKYGQEPDHFFDTEALPADFGPLPDGRWRFVQRCYEFRQKALAAGADPKEADKLLPDKVGFQPYVALEIYGRLKVAFREYRHAKAEHRSTQSIERNIVYYAGWLGHYVADASNPMHVTVNYDGWVMDNPNGYRTQKGLHFEFESRFVHDNLSRKDVESLAKEGTQLGNPWNDYQAYMKQSLAELEPLYKLEKAGAFKDKGTSEGREFVKQRLAIGAQMLASMWYTAWMESAVDPPDPYAPKPTTPSSTGGDKK
jgi:hypothetical protein